MQVVCPKPFVVVTATVASVVKSIHFNFQQFFLQTYYIQKINVNKNMRFSIVGTFSKISLVLGVPAGSIPYSVTTSVVQTYLLNHRLRTLNEAFLIKIQKG